ncbi:MAG: hypothetical protein FJ054_09915 [Cyanobacteria bacterium M_surface_10_m2_119]|nr:hypothetical protein [Cyanobacteria bacterium M_surface_10_m2_119]
MTSNSTSAAGRAQLLDRPPNRCYQSGFLAPTETSLSERAVDAAADEIAAQVASAGGALGKRRERPARATDSADTGQIGLAL